jgi:cob(I)alamin adenosyltransferase
MGYVQIYTGAGKGKTTAAIGAAVRAAGASLCVYIMQFMKGKVYSEHKILNSLKPNVELYTTGKPFFVAEEGMLTEEEIKEFGDDVVVFKRGCPPADYVALIADGFKKAAAAMASGKYDLVILDEVIMAAYFSLLSPDALMKAIKARHERTEVILTGRGANRELIEMADLVTEMREVKHYYTQGVAARQGIEF